MNKFNAKKYLQVVCGRLRKHVGGETVLAAVSGGVDSTTCAAILKRAGIKTKLAFVDTGFMRENEAMNVKASLKKAGFPGVQIVSKQTLFLSRLRKKSSAREKRSEFRNCYFQVLRGLMKKNKARFLVQGTQFHYGPARINNNCPRGLLDANRAVEPVKGLMKDEIRVLAKELGVPDEIVFRRPFPGPGLLLRFGGAYDPSKLKTIKEATLRVDAFLDRHKQALRDYYQVFPYLTADDRVPFVNGDNKMRFGRIILLRSIEQTGRNATVKYPPKKFPPALEKALVSDLMKLKGVARVCLDLTPKYGAGRKVRPGATIEYT